MSLHRKTQASTAIARSHESFGEIPHIIKSPTLSSMRTLGGSHGNLQSASSFDSWDRHQMAQQRGSLDNVSIASDATDWKVIGGRKFQAAQPRKTTEEIIEHLKSRGTSREQSFLSDSEIYEPRKSLSRSSLIAVGTKSTTPTPRATSKHSNRRTLKSRDQQAPRMLEQQGTGLSDSSTASSTLFPPGPVLAFQLPRIDNVTHTEEYILTSGAGGRVLYTDTELDQYMASIERSRAQAARGQQLSYAILPTLRQIDRRGEPVARRSTRNKQVYKQRELDRLAANNLDVYGTLTDKRDERARNALRHIARKY